MISTVAAALCVHKTVQSFQVAARSLAPHSCLPIQYLAGFQDVNIKRHVEIAMVMVTVECSCVWVSRSRPPHCSS